MSVPACAATFLSRTFTWKKPTGKPQVAAGVDPVVEAQKQVAKWSAAFDRDGPGSPAETELRRAKLRLDVMETKAISAREIVVPTRS